MNRRSLLLFAVFLLPLLLALGMGLLGFEVSSRDDWNYLAELADRPALAPTLDAISWAVLSTSTALFGIDVMSLRLVGFLVALATLLILVRRARGIELVSLFVVSVLPLYITIYFSQLRVAIALLIFVWIVTSERFHKLAIPASAFAHSSFLILLFPPLVLLIPFSLGISSQIAADSLVAVKLISYLEGYSNEMPWYFGWELVGIAFIVGVQKRWRWVLEIVVVVVAARLICIELSLDVGRRILEIGILAYSPFFLWVQRKHIPSVWLIRYFALLGTVQTAISLYAGVAGF